ncbi:mechanosensitive ion channel family protein [archaeon]|jgi:MscS family membrane protein|nr:mechanosensitive ion channel family protein [archaeon]
MLDQYISNDYLRALVVMIILFIVIRLGLYFVTKIAIFLTRKTKSDLDDKLIERSSNHLHLLTLFIVLFFGIGEISLAENVKFIVYNIIHSLMAVVLAHLIYVVLDLLFIRAVSLISQRTKTRVNQSLVALFHSFLSVVLILLVVIYILDLWGFEIGPLLAGLGIAGLAIALALQPILSNIFSGASVILDKSVKVGDLVYLESQSIKGRIEKIGLRSTQIRTFDNELIIIPNNKLADGVIQNVALPEPKTRVTVPFGVAYGSDIAQVKKIVLGEIGRIKDFVNEPEPVIRFSEMADSSLNFTAYFYVNSFENRASALDEANTRIYNALNKAGIEIPFPQMDVRVEK